MEVMVRLSPKAAAARRRGDDAPLQRALAAHRAAIEPLDPGAGDPEMSRYFVVSAAESADVERLLADLRVIDGVESAYRQPAAGLPSA